MKQNHEI